MHHMDIPMDYHVWVLCWNTTKDICQSWPTSCRAERPFCRW